MRLTGSLTVAILLACSSPLTAQKVLIGAGAKPTDVVQAVAIHLGERYKLEDSSSKQALFTMDRGMVSQNRYSGAVSVPVTLEFHLKFKQKGDSLEVSAYEEVVGRTRERQSQVEFRQPVRNPLELQSMQRLLDNVKMELEARH